MRLTAEGGRIRKMNVGETLARMLCSGGGRIAREDFFALSTEQVAIHGQPDGVDRRCGIVKQIVPRGVGQPSRGRSGFNAFPRGLNVGERL